MISDIYHTFLVFIHVTRMKKKINTDNIFKLYR